MPPITALNIDNVNMANLRLSLHIPLLVDHSQRGKLNFSYSLSFSGTSWYGLCTSGMYPTCWWKPALPANVAFHQGSYSEWTAASLLEASVITIRIPVTCTVPMRPLNPTVRYII